MLFRSVSFQWLHSFCLFYNGKLYLNVALSGMLYAVEMRSAKQGHDLNCCKRCTAITDVMGLSRNREVCSKCGVKRKIFFIFLSIFVSVLTL